MSDTEPHPHGIALVAVDRVQPCPIQPRVNFSADLIGQLSNSMRAGRHQPLLEVEPASDVEYPSGDNAAAGSALLIPSNS